MVIRIGEKLKPYSHQPGTRVVLPLSHCVVQAFPALFRIEGAGEWSLGVTGPVKEFTVELDLEHNCVWMWGHGNEGYYRLKLEASETGIALTVDRAPAAGIAVGSKMLGRKEKLLLTGTGHVCTKPGHERLSLGNWKAQDWDLVQRRMDLKEIAPILFTLGQRVPTAKEAKGPVADVLKKDLKSFVRVGMSGLFVPRLNDELHQGIVSEERGHGDPFSLLREAYWQIRICLLDGMKVLPHLPHDWDAGRATGLQTGVGEIDIEWSKRAIRQMEFRSVVNGEVTFQFQKGIGSCRVGKERLKNGEPLIVEALRTYRFDRFQK
ncbi:MAG: hypothetical protein KGJ02_03725 [Verrucomicrobiota bacterium]|nr:hypothetical protein [Verrucomicrobiota bacterium]